MEDYTMIFKRKSFHLFRDTGKISPTELADLQKKCNSLSPLCPDIKTKIEIVPESETTCKRGAEYCILFYSEQKDNYLQNIGYLGEQLDLYLAAQDIGALWFGIGKPKRQDSLAYVIMIAIAKMPADKFRKDMFKSKRKSGTEIWHGDCYADIADIVRFAPSACNTQPWLVEADANSISVFRCRPAKRGIMPVNKVSFYNRIDSGIFLYFLELCLAHSNFTFVRTLHPDNTEEAKSLVAVYREAALEKG